LVAKSLLVGAALQVELSVESWPFVPLVQLPPLKGPLGHRRHVQDVQLKEEMLSTANRAGCGMTATRLRLAQRVGLQGDMFRRAPLAGTAASRSASSSAASSSSSSSSGAAPAGSFAVREEQDREDARVHTLEDADPLKLRDQTDFHWPVQHSYMKTVHQTMGKEASPLHISMDGVQADQLGELNSYWAIKPERPCPGAATDTSLYEFLAPPPACKMRPEMTPRNDWNAAGQSTLKQRCRGRYNYSVCTVSRAAFTCLALIYKSNCRKFPRSSYNP
jgi:hypothetical protein